MDWDLKMPSWGLAEFDRDAASDVNNIGSVVLGSSGAAPAAQNRQTTSLDCSVDLKLGGLGDFGSSAKWKEQQAKVPTVSPSKRSRIPSGRIQNASCSVDGCKAELSKCREYHRRHKVCEVHSKTPVVMVGGQEQRFCQQCSRFHMLTEFDEVKRSCRKRLDGHNKRRRKPQPDSVNSGNLFSGARLSSYSQIFPTTAPEPNWPRIVKEENPLYAPQATPHLNGRDQYFPCPNNYSKDRKRFPFLHESNTNLCSTAAFGTSVNQPQIRSIATMSGSTSGSSSSSSSKMFTNEPAQVFHSDCARSLLSSSSQTSSSHLSHMVPSGDRIPIRQPRVPSLQYIDYAQYCHSQKPQLVSATGFSCSGMDDEHVGTVLVPDANDAELHCPSIFQFRGEGSSDVRSTETLAFSWQ